MKRWEIAHPSAALADKVEAVAASLGLTCTMRGTLAKHPGCTHWHFKQGTEKGVVEATVWPRSDGVIEAWVSVQAGRSGPSTEQLAAKLAASLQH